MGKLSLSGIGKDSIISLPNTWERNHDGKTCRIHHYWTRSLWQFHAAGCGTYLTQQCPHYLGLKGLLWCPDTHLKDILWLIHNLCYKDNHKYSCSLASFHDSSRLPGNTRTLRLQPTRDTYRNTTVHIGVTDNMINYLGTGISVYCVECEICKKQTNKQKPYLSMSKQ